MAAAVRPYLFNVFKAHINLNNYLFKNKLIIKLIIARMFLIVNYLLQILWQYI